MSAPDPSLTFKVAVYGAVLSTLALGWNIVRDLFDRRERVRVTAAIGNLVGKGVQDPQDYLFFTITNLSRQSDVVIKQIGEFHGVVERWSRLRKQADWGVILTKAGELPRRLAPSEQADILLPFIEPASYLRTRRLFVTDSRGRRHYVSRSNVRRLKQQIVRRTPDAPTAEIH